MNPDIISNTVSNLFGDIYSSIGSFLSALISGDIQSPGSINIKIISFVVCIILILLIYIVIKKLTKINPVPAIKILNSINPPKPSSGGALQARWDEVLRHSESTKEAEWKFAVIEADKIVEGILARAGFGGATMGERLQNIDKSKLVSLDDLWEAHKIRNKLAHEPNYFLRYAEAKRAVGFYESVLRELDVL